MTKRIQLVILVGPVPQMANCHTRCPLSVMFQNPAFMTKEIWAISSLMLCLNMGTLCNWIHSFNHCMTLMLSRLFVRLFGCYLMHAPPPPWLTQSHPYKLDWIFRYISLYALINIYIYIFLATNRSACVRACVWCVFYFLQTQSGQSFPKIVKILKRKSKWISGVRSPCWLELDQQHRVYYQSSIACFACWLLSRVQ